MPQAAFESPELVELFTTYTASPDSIGAHLARAAARETEHDPLLVVTGTDLALYPGGRAALVASSRRAARPVRRRYGAIRSRSAPSPAAKSASPR